MRIHRRKLVVGAAALVAAAAVGGAIAATQLTSPRQESQAIVDDAAEELGVTPAELRTALRNALAKRVDAAVDAGRLTEKQGERQKERIQSGEVPLFAGPPFFGRRGGVVLGHAGPGIHHFGRRGGIEFRPVGPGIHHFGRLGALEDAASYLDLSRAELGAQLGEGKTLAEVARAEDKSVDGLVDALVKAENKRLDEAVEDGRLPEARRDELAKNLEQRTRALVNGKFGGGYLRPLPLPSPGGRGAIFLGPFRGLEDAASYLDLSEAELRAELEEGKTLAEVARAEEKSVDGLVEAMVEAETKNLDKAVEDRRLTEARRDRIAANLEERTRALVNGEFRRSFGRILSDGHFSPRPSSSGRD